MEIDLHKRLDNQRSTRVVLGQSFSMDVSYIFDGETRDFLTDELITHDNFDEDDVWFIKGIGFTRRKSLLDVGYSKIVMDSLDSPVYEDDLVE